MFDTASFTARVLAGFTAVWLPPISIVISEISFAFGLATLRTRTAAIPHETEGLKGRRC
jgi:hypothetical protein